MDSWTRTFDLFKAIANACPLPTRNLKLNTKNRDAAGESKHIQYGPLNLDDEVFWMRLAKFWKTTPKVVKKSRCGNCAAFDISPKMKKCMPGELSDEAGHLGYCWMHNFKCHSARVCRTWVVGGPIESDEVSEGWKKRSN